MSIESRITNVRVGFLRNPLTELMVKVILVHSYRYTVEYRPCPNKHPIALLGTDHPVRASRMNPKGDTLFDVWSLLTCYWISVNQQAFGRFELLWHPLSKLRHEFR